MQFNCVKSGDFFDYSSPDSPHIYGDIPGFEFEFAKFEYGLRINLI